MANFGVPGQEDNIGSSPKAFAITPNDSADLSDFCRAIVVGTEGVVKYHNFDGLVCTTASLPAGVYPFQIRRVLATGTTASDLTGVV